MYWLQMFPGLLLDKYIIHADDLWKTCFFFKTLNAHLPWYVILSERIGVVKMTMRWKIQWHDVETLLPKLLAQSG